MIQPFTENICEHQNRRTATKIDFFFHKRSNPIRKGATAQVQNERP
jgi:hypothetical protein